MVTRGNTLSACANPTCRLPTALDHCPQAPAGFLCVEHLAVAGLGDLSAVDGQVTCQAMAGGCPMAATKDCDIIGWYCEWHAPKKWRPKRKDDSVAIAKSRAFMKTQRNKPKLSLDDIEV